MTEQSPMRRFRITVILSAGIYVATSFALAWAQDNSALSPLSLFMLSILPVLALLKVFQAYWNLVRQLDEYLRLLHTRSILMASAAILLIITVWGYLEISTDVPRLPIYYLLPVFMIVFAISIRFFKSRLDGTTS